jgi:DNA-binding MarR family transcriptional regulator
VAGWCATVPGPLDYDPIEDARRQWPERWGGDAVPAMSAVGAIVRAQLLLGGRINALLQPHGLTLSRYHALIKLVLTEEGALPLGVLSARMEVHPTAITSLVRALERDGLVRRDRLRSDRRTTLAAITPAGREAAEAATVTLNASRFGMDGIADADLEAVYAILRGMWTSARDVAPAD